MLTVRVTLTAALLTGCALAAEIIPGDARRGEQVFKTEQCIQCHSINGVGGKAAPDLGKRIDRNFTPSVLSSLMWNHAPSMWSAMQKERITKSSLSPESAADLFAYFVAARFFEKPGDAGRGKLAFSTRHCAECHGITDSKSNNAPPVNKWQSLADPILLAQQMWNHGPSMKAAFASKNLKWGELTAQELTDILVYLQNLPETRGMAANFNLSITGSGEELFKSKGCVDCHTGRMALENRLRNQTISDIATAMWNHQPSMKNPPPTFTGDEMRQVLAYVWARQYFTGDGNAGRGRKVFEDKNCANCHNDPASGAPKLGKAKNSYSDVTMISTLWEHGPRMLSVMQQRRLPWPRFNAREMSDLIAYLNSL